VMSALVKVGRMKRRYANDCGEMLSFDIFSLV
jgi:hypothetical protein